MGTVPFGFGTQRLGVRMFSSTTSSLPGLEQLIAAFERERLNIGFETYRFDDVENGYDDLRAGAIDGRAVVDFSLDKV
jgi:D-arabinose 1-dehydrogenase-like Zn-dependent alcohol dehydrogenase